MLRARRLASVAVAAALTVGGLSACRSEPDVAAYLGSAGKISLDQVDAIYDDARDKLAAQQAQAGAQGAPDTALAPLEVPISGPDIVGAMITREVVSRAARAANVTLPPQLPLAEAGQAIGLPADTQYVRLYAESRLLLNQLLQNAPASNPPDADVRRVFEIFEATGAMRPGLGYEEFRGSVSPEALQTLGRAIAVKQQVQAEADKLDLRINPRYGTVEIPVYTETGPDEKPLNLVSVSLADDDAAPVVDAS